jgi:hypothetical protein
VGTFVRGRQGTARNAPDTARQVCHGDAAPGGSRSHTRVLNLRHDEELRSRRPSGRREVLLALAHGDRQDRGEHAAPHRRSHRLHSVILSSSLSTTEIGSDQPVPYLIGLCT